LREATFVITRLARPEDLPGFLRLAGEVEQRFGPMVDDDGFRTAVMRNIGRGTALVDDHQGSGLLGGSALRREFHDLSHPLACGR
jgi:hypothetical protein